MDPGDWHSAISKWEKWCYDNPDFDLSSHPIERLFNKGVEAESRRRARLFGTIARISEDLPDNPFEGVEVPFPWCHNCEADILEEGITFQDEKICGDCSSIACKHCNKTFYELGFNKENSNHKFPGLTDCWFCGEPMCDEECMIECDLCEVRYCPECSESGEHNKKFCNDYKNLG